MRTFGPALSQRKDSRPSLKGPTASEPGAARATSQETPRIAGGSDFSQAAVTSAPRPGLTLGAIGDEHEREADQSASDALGAPAPMPTSTADELPGQAVPAIVHDAVRGGGQPLDPGTRAALEPRFGRDLSQVRVHADHLAARSAAAVGADAFTVGQHIAFGAGRHNPGTTAGRRLLAHEIAHTLQPDAPATVRRQPAATRPRQAGRKAFDITIPADVSTTQQFLRYVEVRIFGRVTNTPWDLSAAPSVRDPARHAREHVTVWVSAADLKANGAAGHAPAGQSSTQPGAHPPLDEDTAADVNAEADRRYYRATGITPGTKIGPGQAGQAAIWNSIRAEILADRAALGQLPAAVRDLLGPENFTPEHYAMLRLLGGTLAQLTDAELHSFFLVTKDAPAITPADYAQLLAVASRLVALAPEARQDYLSRVGATGSLGEMAAALDRYSQFRETRQAQAAAHDAAASPLLNSGDAYTAYRDYVFLSELATNWAEPAEKRSWWAQVNEARAKLAVMLHPLGFDSVEAFEKAIESYRLAFRTQAVNLALDVLDRYEQMLFTERRALDGGGARRIAEGIAKSGAAEHFAESNRQHSYATALVMGADEFDTTVRDLSAQAEAKSVTARQEGEEAVRTGSGNNPLVRERGTDLEYLAGLDEARTKAYLLQLIDKRTGEIATARGEFATDPERVFSQAPLVNATETMLNIDPDTIYGKIIAQHIADEKAKHLFSQIALTVLGLALLFVVPIGGWVAAAALVGQAGLNFYLARSAYEEYQQNKRDWDLGFIDDEPSLIWVGVAIAGAVVDLGPAASAVIKESALALRSLKGPLVTFSEGGDLATLLEQIKVANSLNQRVKDALESGARAADQARGAWQSVKAGTRKTNAFVGMIDPAVPIDLARALYYTVKRKVVNAIQLSADAKFLGIAGELTRMTGAERTELEAALGEMEQLVAAGQAKKMDDETLLGFVDRWAVSRRKPGFLAKLADEMKRWKPLNEAQLQARSGLRAQAATVANLYQNKFDALWDLDALATKSRTARLTRAEIDRRAEQIDRLYELDPSILGESRDPRKYRAAVGRFGERGRIHAEEQTLRAAEEQAARLELSLYDRIRAVTPSPRMRAVVRRGVTADQIGLKVAPTGLEVEHIVPVREIVDMDGFADLLWEDQKAIADMRENLIVMDEVANRTKSDWSWRSWPEASRFYEEKDIARMITREDAIRGLITDRIKERLDALRAGARP